MAERPIYLHGANVGFVAGIVVATVLCALLAVGPGRSMISARADALAAAEERLDAWLIEQQTTRPGTSAERAGWEPAWQGLLARVPASAHESQRIALLASAFEGPSVRRIQIQKSDASTAQVDGGSEDVIALLSPVGEEAIEISSIPFSVTFVSLHRDAVSILARLEDRSLPVRVESIDIRRDHPDIEVRLELTYFTRVGEEAS